MFLGLQKFLVFRIASASLFFLPISFFHQRSELKLIVRIEKLIFLNVSTFGHKYIQTFTEFCFSFFLFFFLLTFTLITIVDNVSRGGKADNLLKSVM